MTAERLAVILAERLMGWRLGKDRFLTEGGGWKPTWKFQPVERRADALRLVDAAKPTEYSICALRGGEFKVRVQIGTSIGIAQEASEPRAITYAVARAVGVEPTVAPAPKTGADR